MTLKKISLLSFIISICSYYSDAQWTNNALLNTNVRDSIGTAESTPLSATTDNGKTYVSFFEQYNGNYEMRMQLLDSAGNKMWAPEGVVVSSFPQSSALFRYDLKVDNNNNAIVAFQDIRSGGNLNVVVYKVDSTGNLVWGINGVQLIDPISTTGLAPVLGITNSNNIIVAWGSDNGSGKWVSFNKLDPTGGLLWNDTHRVIDSVGTKKYSRPSIVASGIDDFTMMYVEESGNFPGVTSSIYAQQYDVTGAKIWANATLVSTKTISFFFFPRIESDLNGGFFISFNTSNATFPGQTDVYVQHVRADGSTWNATGNVACTLANTQHFSAGSATLYDSANSSVWVLLKITDTGQVMSGVSVQKFDTSGTVLLNTDGVALASISANYYDPRDFAITPDGIIVVYSSGTNPTQQTLIAAKCDLAGIPAWGGAPVTICSNIAGKDDLSAGLFKNNQVVFVWDDQRNDYGVYAQNITNEGLLGSLSTAIYDVDHEIFINVFPNPFSDILQIELSEIPDRLLYVYDARGTLILVRIINSKTIKLNTTNWPAGLYLINVGNKSFRIMRQ